MEKILLGHGSGGRLMHELIRDCFAPAFNVEDLNDAAIIKNISPDFQGKGGRLAFTTDSYVVSPIFFPGGDIGELAVNGTVNDLAMVGARPLCLSAGFIIEEGLLLDDLKKIVSSMANAAKRAGVRIITGDTKVVDKGKGDGIFINTSGVGLVPGGVELGPDKIKAGDKIVISGAIGKHGIAVLSERNGLTFVPPVLSDTAALNGLVELMFECAGGDIRMMRDPTRGGVATTLKEISMASDCCISLFESLLPVPGGVRGACDLLGLDPLFIANEGVLLAVVSESSAELLVERMRTHAFGREAAIIGEVSDSDPRHRGMVLVRTEIGGTRILGMLTGEQLPRIC